MVNASLNWASIVGIALAVCGAGLYFMRSFKPALARDYDVFFAAIGLLCGGILFFQGWRLDPILQFGQFLLAGTTVFFAYESVRLRGVAADQARRSSYFDDEEDPPLRPSASRGGSWDDSYEQFGEPAPVRRRFSGQNDILQEGQEEDLYRPRRTSRAAIPEEAVSRQRRSDKSSWDEENSTKSRRIARFSNRDEEVNAKSTFGQRRNTRQEERRGSRPSINQQTSSRRRISREDNRTVKNSGYSSSADFSRGKKDSLKSSKAEDASFSPSKSRSRGEESSFRSGQIPSRYSSQTRPGNPQTRRPRSRDNSSRFDD